MKLYKLLTVAVTVFATVAFASITAFSEEVLQAAPAEGTCAEATASMGFVPIAIAALIIPSAVIAIRNRRKP